MPGIVRPGNLACLLLTVQNQGLNDFANQVVSFDRPESAQAVGFRGTTLAVDRGIDVTARVFLEEFAECAVGEIEHVAATHAEQPFQLASFYGGQIGHGASRSAISLRQVGGANGTQHFPKDVIERWQMVHLVRETGGPEPS